MVRLITPNQDYIDLSRVYLMTNPKWSWSFTNEQFDTWINPVFLKILEFYIRGPMRTGVYTKFYPTRARRL